MFCATGVILFFSWFEPNTHQSIIGAVAKYYLSLFNRLLDSFTNVFVNCERESHKMYKHYANLCYYIQ